MKIKVKDGRENLWQWDTDRKIIVDTPCDMVHFSNMQYGKAISVKVAENEAKIPDELLQSGAPLYCYIFVGSVESGHTEYVQVIAVEKKPKPVDYVFTPTEYVTIEKLNERVSALEEQGGGEGFSPVVEITPLEHGHRVTITDINGSHSFDVPNGKDGEKGAKGDKGDKGEDGKTPAKGVDYFTAEDIDEIKSQLAEDTSNILMVTAKAVFTSQTGGHLAEVSHTYEEIRDAYNNGQFVYFCINAGMFEAGTIFVMPLNIINQNGHICCSTIIDIDGEFVYIQVFILASNKNSFMLETMSQGESESDSNSNTLEIPCVIDFASMTAQGIDVDKQTLIDVFNAGKYICLKADISQSSIDVATSYAVAPLTQFSHVLNDDTYILEFDFIMAVNGAPTNINAQLTAGNDTARVRMTPLATQEQIGSIDAVLDTINGAVI